MGNFRFFFYYIGFLPLLEFEPLCLSAIRNFKCFSRHNSRKLRQTTCIENRENFALHSSTWPSGAKGGWRVSSWLAISTHVKNTIFFHVCCYGFSQGQKSLYNTALYLIITFYKVEGIIQNLFFFLCFGNWLRQGGYKLPVTFLHKFCIETSRD